MSVHVIAVDFTEAPSRTDRELVACRQEGAQRPYACLIKRARSVHILDGSTTTTITTTNNTKNSGFIDSFSKAVEGRTQMLESVGA